MKSFVVVLLIASACSSKLTKPNEDGRSPETAVDARADSFTASPVLPATHRPLEHVELVWNPKIAKDHRCYLIVPLGQKVGYVTVPEDWCAGMR